MDEAEAYLEANWHNIITVHTPALINQAYKQRLLEIERACLVNTTGHGAKVLEEDIARLNKVLLDMLETHLQYKHYWDYYKLSERDSLSIELQANGRPKWVIAIIAGGSTKPLEVLHANNTYTEAED